MPEVNTTKPVGLGPNQQLWVGALRSGKYTQTRGALHNVETGGMCCLGVASKLFLTNGGVRSFIGYYLYDGHHTLAPDYVAEKLCLYDEYGSANKGNSLIGLNDSGVSFAEIADLVEENPTHYFSSAK